MNRQLWFVGAAALQIWSVWQPTSVRAAHREQIESLRPSTSQPGRQPSASVREDSLSLQELKRLRNATAFESIVLGRFDRVDGELSGGNQADRALSRAWLMLLAKTYHDKYWKLCGRSPKESWSLRVARIVEKNRQGTVVGMGATDSNWIRTKYSAVYAEAARSELGSSLLLIGGSQGGGLRMLSDLSADVESFSKAYNCSAATVELFEANMSRAVLRERSLQSTQQGLARFPAYARGCARQDASLNLAKPAVCECTYDALSAVHGADRIYDLEDNFTMDRFLALSVAQLGLMEKVRSCFKR